MALHRDDLIDGWKHPKAPQYIKTPEQQEKWLQKFRNREKRKRAQIKARREKEEAEATALVAESYVDAATRGPSKRTRVVKDAINEVFDALGGAAGLYAFAKTHPKEFYTQIWGKMIPRTKEVDVGENLEELLQQIGGGNVPGMLEGPILEGEFTEAEGETE